VKKARFGGIGNLNLRRESGFPADVVPRRIPSEEYYSSNNSDKTGSPKKARNHYGKSHYPTNTKHILARRKQTTVRTQDQGRKKSKSPQIQQLRPCQNQEKTEGHVLIQSSHTSTAARGTAPRRPLMPTGLFVSTAPRQRKEAIFHSGTELPHLLPLLRVRQRTRICLRHRQAAAGGIPPGK